MATRFFYSYVIEMLGNLDYCFISNVDLSGNILNDIHIIKLVELLRNHPEVITLNLADNGTRDDGAIALAEKTTLATLNLHDNEIGYDGIKALSRNTTLTNLNLSLNKAGNIGAIELAKNITITTLILSYNEIRDDGAIVLAKNTIIINLNLSGNEIGDDGAIALAANTTLINLNLLDNVVGNIGAIVLAGNTTITTLDLSYNPIGDTGTIALTANTILTTLHLFGIKIRDGRTIPLAENSTITTLNSINDETEDDETDQKIVWYIETRSRKRYEALKWAMQQMLNNQHNWQTQQVPNTKKTAQEIIQQHKNIDNIKIIIEGIKAQNNLLLAFVGAGRSKKPLDKSLSGEISKFFWPDLRRKDLSGNNLSDNGLNRYENIVKRVLSPRY